jgi:G6PDH family F420-dependent oxidoreductase
MIELGYSLSCEEHPPAELVRAARGAEEAGFAFAMISDHYHPWTDRQGQAPFAWTVIGAVAQATERLRLGTAVTCPTIRYHPALVAQMAATAAALMPGRFFLGVGTGENLNEHIYGDRWPSYAVRREMLEEAVAVMRLLWQGGMRSHRGRHYTVEDARVYTLPPEPVRVLVAGAGPHSADLAGRIGDGFVSTAPQKEFVQRFEAAGGAGKPRYGQLTVCWAADEASAKRTAREIWPNAALHGEVSQELPVPRHFEEATKEVTEDQVAKMVVCGPDPQRHLAEIKKYADAGFDHLFIHQVGPDQEGFFRFYEREILPRVGSLELRRSA